MSARRTHNLGHRLTLIGFIASLAILSLPPPAAAQYTWTGTGSGSWNDANNWSSGVIPPSNSNTQLVFGASSNTAMTHDIPGAPYFLNRLTFDAGDPDYTLTGNALSFRTNTSNVLASIV